MLAGEFDAATRDQWRELVAGVLRKAGREELPDPVEEALRRTVATGVTVAPLYTAEDAGDLPDRGRCARAGAVRARRPRRRRPGGGMPAGWDVRQRHAAPRRRRHEGGRRSPTWRTASPRCGWSSARARSRSTRSAPVLDDVLLDLAPVTVRAAALPAAEAFLALVEGRTDLAPRRLARPRPARACRRRPGERQDLSGAGRPRPPGRGARGAAQRRRRRDGLRRRRRLGGGGARLLAGRRGGLPAGADRRRALRRRGVRRAGVPLRRHRRPVHDDRRAARRPPAVGPGRRGQRRLARRPRPAPARGHLVGDDHRSATRG